MGPRGRRAAIVTTIVVLSMLVAGAVVAATRSTDEAALQPTRQPAIQLAIAGRQTDGWYQLGEIVVN